MEVSCARELYVYLALLLLVVPVRLLLAVVVSAVVHELFHILAIRLIRIQINSIHIAPRGAVLLTQPMNPKQELLCALAGPLGGFMLFLFFPWMPVISLVSITHSLYNLLPLYPTDGGRILQCLTQLACSAKVGGLIVYWVEAITLSLLIALSVYCSVRIGFGIIPIIFGVSLLLRFAKRK